MTTPLADLPATLAPSAPRHPPGQWRRRLLWAALAVALTGLVLLGALGAVLRAALAPKPGEWAVDIGRAPFSLRASVPQLVWLGTTPWLGERLHGLRVATRLGPVTLGWVPAGAEGPQAG